MTTAEIMEMTLEDINKLIKDPEKVKELTEEQFQLVSERITVLNIEDGVAERVDYIESGDLDREVEEAFAEREAQVAEMERIQAEAKANALPDEEE